MAQRREDPPDLIDRAMEMPLVGSAATRFQRVVGPSCFVSLVLAAFILFWLRRYIALPLPIMVVVAGLVWVGVLSVLVRIGNANPDGDADPGSISDRGA